MKPSGWISQLYSLNCDTVLTLMFKADFLTCIQRREWVSATLASIGLNRVYLATHQVHPVETYRRGFEFLIFPFLAKLCDGHRTPNSRHCHVWGLVLSTAQTLHQKYTKEILNNKRETASWSNGTWHTPYKGVSIFWKIKFRKKSSGQMIDFCATNSKPPSVFTFLVGKLPNFCLKDPVANGKSQKKLS